jgi:hypothetical protein
MLAAIIRWSLRFPIVVCALAIILVVYGVVVLSQAKYDVFPEFVPPQASVQTEAPGLVAEQVELLVTLPIERLSAERAASKPCVRRPFRGSRSLRWFFRRTSIRTGPGKLSRKPWNRSPRVCRLESGLQS